WQQRDTTVRLACNHPFLISGNIRSKTATQTYCRALGVDVADVHRISIAAECRLVRECQQRAVVAEDVPDGVEVGHAALHCRLVEDRLAVRRKTRRVDGPGTERYGA